jgi:hypothetical protein
LLFFLRLGRERLGVAAAATARLTQIEFNELGTQGLNLLLHFGAYVVGPQTCAPHAPRRGNGLQPRDARAQPTTREGLAEPADKEAPL